MNIGDTIRKFREDRRMTKTEMGKLLGISGQLLGQYEKGRQKPKTDFYIKFKNAFNVNLSPVVETNVSSGEVGSNEETPILGLLKLMYEQMRVQNRILEDTTIKQIGDIKEKLDSNSENIKMAAAGVISLTIQMDASREVVLKSLSRIEKKPEDYLLGELGKAIHRKMSKQKKQDNGVGVGR